MRLLGGVKNAFVVWFYLKYLVEIFYFFYNKFVNLFFNGFWIWLLVRKAFPCLKLIAEFVFSSNNFMVLFFLYLNLWFFESNFIFYQTMIHCHSTIYFKILSFPHGFEILYVFRPIFGLWIILFHWLCAWLYYRHFFLMHFCII